MRLTKLNHACVLLEDEEHTALIDPGQFAWETGRELFEKLTSLDYVMVSHEHFDHFYEPFAKAIIKKFPKAQFFTTPSVASQLKALGAQFVSTTGNDHVDTAPLNHDGMAPLGPSPPCENVRFHYKGRLSHPGDSIHLEDTKDILLLPLAGPWESAVDAVALADKLKPKVVVPIHDWMWNDQWRSIFYERLEDFFAKQGIRFVKAKNGESFEA